MGEPSKTRVAQPLDRPPRAGPDAASDDVAFRGIELVQTRLELRGRDRDRPVDRTQHRLVRLPHDVLEGGGVDLRDVDGARFIRELADLRYAGPIAAQRAVGVAHDLHLAHPRIERVDQEEATDERLADPEEKLEDLIGLPRPDDTGEDAEDAALGAGRDRLGGRRLRKEATVAGPSGGREDRDLTVEAEDRTVNVRLALEDAGVVDQVSRGERIGPVDDDVVESDEFASVRRVEADGDRIDRDLRIERMQPLRRDARFRLPDVARRIEDLALQIRYVDRIVVDDPDAPDPGGGEIGEDRRAQAARADAQHPCRRQLTLPIEPDFGYEEMPAVAPQIDAPGRERRRSHATERSARGWRSFNQASTLPRAFSPAKV